MFRDFFLFTGILHSIIMTNNCKNGVRTNIKRLAIWTNFFHHSIDFVKINSNNMSGKESKEQHQEQSQAQESREQYPQTYPYNYQPYYPSIYNIPPS